MSNHEQHMQQHERDYVREARIEVLAAKQNLSESVKAAIARLDRANALLRAALGEKD